MGERLSRSIRTITSSWRQYATKKNALLKVKRAGEALVETVRNLPPIIRRMACPSLEVVNDAATEQALLGKLELDLPRGISVHAVESRSRRSRESVLPT